MFIKSKKKQKVHLFVQVINAQTVKKANLLGKQRRNI